MTNVVQLQAQTAPPQGRSLKSIMLGSAAAPQSGEATLDDFRRLGTADGAICGATFIWALGRDHSNAVLIEQYARIAAAECRMALVGSTPAECAAYRTAAFAEMNRRMDLFTQAVTF